MRTIRGKKTLVTGAASGIGRAIALKLAHAGAKLFLLDINQDRLESVVQEICPLNVECHGIRCDVASRDDINASIDTVLQCWGHIDILVNNAGVAYYGPTLKMPPREWDRLMAINLLAPIHFTQRLLPILASRPEAHILNVSSICGQVGTSRLAAYTTAKFGLVGLSESLRAEFRRSPLGVTVLCPGLVSTNLFDGLSHHKKHHKPVTPPRWAQTSPERIANKAVRAILRNQGLVLATPVGYLLYYLKRVSPWLLDTLWGIGRRKNPKPIKVMSQDPSTVVNYDTPSSGAGLNHSAANAMVMLPSHGDASPPPSKAA
jgi:short-subunit dehydrogenase